MLIGYARVSTAEQDLTPQLVALKEAGCDRTFSDKASGAKANRTGLAEALSHAREGDVLVVWKLDRLGRTMKGLVVMICVGPRRATCGAPKTLLRRGVMP